MNLQQQAFEIGYEAAMAGRPTIIAMNLEINNLLESLQGKDQHEDRMAVMRSFIAGVQKQADEELAL